ncbi:hypothetical protein DICPUDRAFT_87062 [Dictyostelium purpureum]|uniref:Transmembrane protein n=1 Tax=Dictyostelium purpureum TaxID=5786 RepID=F0ZFQ7_DICPU|nr:uncharacterized protein DICPUDRAFT_87062 [Dictyostelium purpureum]EGC37197.1 hypothetical protein DICPUDRAFT_87062 [Dictyostelium purpureum]|eukprot:XP_003286248.1 hypothetical protein DICPUDRAFT_87062 [Dictyostelium purpureum]
MVKQRKPTKVNNNNNSNNSNSSNSKINNEENENLNVNNKNEIFQNIDNIFKEFEAEQVEQPRPYNRFWDHPVTKKVIRVLEYIFWLSFGSITAYKTDLINVILYSSDVNRFYFNISILGLVGFIILYVYCAYFSKVEDKRANTDWEKLHPLVIPAATICLVIFTICAIIGFWNVWGFLTPIFLLIYFCSISYLI